MANRTITITLNAKTAIDLMAVPGIPNAVINTIVKAIRSNTVYPKGATSAAISNVARKKNPKKVMKETETEATMNQ